MTEKLRECPFCNEKPFLNEEKNLVRCIMPTCGLFQFDMTIEEWNTRPSPMVGLDELNKINGDFKSKAKGKNLREDVSIAFDYCVKFSEAIDKLANKHSSLVELDEIELRKWLIENMPFVNAETYSKAIHKHFGRRKLSREKLDVYIDTWLNEYFKMDVKFNTRDLATAIIEQAYEKGEIYDQRCL